MKLFKNKNIEDISVIQGGYSDVRLWPCYMAYSASILFFTPIIGIGFSLFIFTAIGLSAAIYASKRMPVVTYDVDAWSMDLDIALEKDLEIPELSSYQIVTPAKVKTPKPKKVTTKRQSLLPYLDMPAVK